jgi:Ca-activated chloride channel family protein
MNHLGHQAARAALPALLISVLVLLTASQTAFCQQTANGSLPNPPAGSEPVVLNVTVMNKSGGYVMGLDKSNFAVFDDKQPQDITYFRGPDEPVSVGIIFDASGSMSDARKRDLLKTLYREAISRFIRQSNEANIYFLIGFNERPQLLLDWRRGTDAVNDVLVKLSSIQFKGNTAFYDACYLGIEKLARSTHRKRAIILIGDGQDNESHYTFSELQRRLRESGVLFYVVALASAVDMVSSLGLQGQSILGELATTSGGMAYLPEKSAHVSTIFDMIAAELRHQYSIGFIPATSMNESEWRRVKIKLVIPPGAPREMQNLIVRSREGYYSTIKRH